MKTKSSMRQALYFFASLLWSIIALQSASSAQTKETDPAIASNKPGWKRTVLLDSYFNNEKKKDKDGTLLSWHYKWEEMVHSGFSILGTVFKEAGFQTHTLYAAPDKSSLKDANIYIIVDPDVKKENENPNFINKKHIKDIANWVKGGGILVMMANDTGNVELDHFNELAMTFGIRFKKESKGRVIGNQFEMGKLMVPANNFIFKTAKQLYIKEYSSIQISDPAKSVITDKDGDHVMAVAKYGKGTVFAIGDPWLYNEYVDGKKLPSAYDNFAAAQDLVNWLSAQIK